MSQEDDMERLRGVYDEWARGEFWNPEIYAPDIVFVLGDSLPEPGTFRGLDGLERGFREWLASWRDLRFELQEMTPAGDAIVAMYHQIGTGRASGARAELDGGHVWYLRDGKAVRLEVHSNREAALEAAGLGTDP
jgi:ketosteroid isomerase-like protein